MADQATSKVQRIKLLKSGERVIVDPAVTVSSIMLLYYCAPSPTKHLPS